MTRTDNLAVMAAEIHALAKEKGWWPDGPAGRNVGELLALVHSELSEALEDWRSGAALDATWRDEKGKPCGFGVELADAIIRLLDLSQAIGIDIAGRIVEKHEFNATRSHRHGGKLA